MTEIRVFCDCDNSNPLWLREQAGVRSCNLCADKEYRQIIRIENEETRNSLLRFYFRKNPKVDRYS